MTANPHGCSAVRSGDPDNDTTEPKQKLITRRIAEIWPFEFLNMAADRRLAFQQI